MNEHISLWLFPNWFLNPLKRGFWINKDQSVNSESIKSLDLNLQVYIYFAISVHRCPLNFSLLILFLSENKNSIDGRLVLDSFQRLNRFFVWQKKISWKLWWVRLFWFKRNFVGTVISSSITGIGNGQFEWISLYKRSSNDSRW